MNQMEIQSELKKAIGLWQDNTYTETEFCSHVISIIKDNAATGDLHKEQLERLMFKVEEMRENQRQFHNGHRNRIGLCKTQEAEIDKKILYLKTNKGYDSDRFKPRATQNKIF